MADGEIEVSVKADGVDDAAGELGGDGSGSSRDRQGAAAGRGEIGKLLVRIAGLLAVLGPILDVVSVVSKVMEAFVAPLAVILLRLLQPVLRFLLFVLPLWIEFAKLIDSVVELLISIQMRVMLWLARIYGFIALFEAMVEALRTARDWLGDSRDRLNDMLTALQNLPSNIAAAIPSPGDVSSGLRERASNQLLGGDDSRRRQAVNIGISGGLEPLIDRITRDGSVDFP